MKSLCVIVGPVCSTDCNLRQGGCEEHQFGFGNGHPDFRHPDTDMGNRVFRKTPDRSQGVKPSHLAFPDSVRCCYGTVVVVLFQGHSDRRCLQSGPHRQVERCLHHHLCLPLPPRESRPASRYRGYPHRRRQHSDAFKMTVCPTVAHPPRQFSLK